ncbi:MAG TPA: hypothetical protein VM364_07900 [Vicinamibacterales bacterium]|nr:hypothetical protein [Vicinamibacterales bacterium]
MSQRQNTQLRLVFSSSSENSPSERSNSKHGKLSSVKCKALRASSSRSRFQMKIARLERERPAAAALIEQLVDDALDDPEEKSGTN